MKQNDNKIEFIINCDVEKIVSLLQEDYGMNILDAFDTIYNSKIYKKTNRYRDRIVYSKSALHLRIPQRGNR